jgi:thiamine-phosphate pyrophosphorylase
MNAPALPGLPAGLYALCDDTVRTDLPLEEKAKRLLAGGVRVMQLRMKLTPLRRAVAAAREISRLCSERGALCLINDRVDLALVAGAQGVHLGDEDLAPEDARRLLGERAIIGVTVRNAEMARDALRRGATYAGIGPVFATSTKQVNVAPLGVEGLARAVRDSPLPLVAIAGISRANIGEVASTGVHGAAVASDLLLADDLAERARELQAAFEAGRRSA